MASDVRRRAAGTVVRLLDDHLTKHVLHPEWPMPLDEKAELLRLKETFERVATAADEPTPEGWTPGDPQIGTCSCDDCVARRVAQAKAEGRLRDPREEETPPCGGSRCHRGPDGEWIHSSKSYGTCTVRTLP